jgi:hypothetical protein
MLGGITGTSYSFDFDSTQGNYLQIMSEQPGAVPFAITGAGNIGIGTTAPAGQLQVMGSTGWDGSGNYYFTNNASLYGRTNLILTGLLDGGNDAWEFGSQARNSIVFNTNTSGVQGAVGTEKYSIQLEGNSGSLGFLSATLASMPAMVLTQSGNVGIGTLSPGVKLDVAGDVRLSGSIIFPDGTTQQTASPALSSSSSPLQLGSTDVTINYGVSSNGSGLKHVRTDASCTTSTSMLSTCAVSITWPGTAFADTNYTITCTPKNITWNLHGATIVAYSLTIPDSSKTTSGASVVLTNLETSGGQPTLAGLNCIAIHD